MDDYKAATINVDTNGTELNPSFDIENWSVYTAGGNFTVEVSTVAGVWGDAIPGISGIGLSMSIACQRIRIKSAVGTIAVNYVINGSL